ncbi:MAG TPA: hypothetical protein VFF73_40915 [Planctomycetota bacterium]|nr:hypothetical protein [Planctomycetota bacterium]
MRKKLAIGAVAIVALLIAVRLVIGASAGRDLVRYDAWWKGEIEKERALAATPRPTILGAAAIDTNVCPRYRAIFVRRDETTAEIESVVKAGVVTPTVLALADRERSSLDALLEAVRCTRCDWEVAYDAVFDTSVPNAARAKALCDLLILEESARRASRGEPLDHRPAALRDLAVVRIGADFELGGTRYHRSIGTALLEIGLRALGELVASAEPGTLPLAEIEKDLVALGARPTLVMAVHRERLGLRSMATAAGEKVEDAASGLAVDRLVVGLALLAADALEGEAETAAANDDRAARDRGLGDVEQKAQESWNPLVRVAVPDWRRFAAEDDRASATFRLVLAAVKVEESRGDGGYPLKLDPGKDVTYERTASGWKLSSSLAKLTLERK